MVEKKRPENIETIPQLRWYLPPTTAAFKYTVFRSHFITLVLRRSLLPLQNLPSPLNYGWDVSYKSYVPIMSDELPAPLALIEHSVCSCKTNCCSNRCKCYKNQLNCTDMCKCIDCENDDADHSDEEIYLQSDDDDEDINDNVDF